MPSRNDLVDRLAVLASPALRLQEDANGWPSLAEVLSERRILPVSLFVGPIGLSHRGRDDLERRFQNPAGGVPLVGQPGRVSLLLGVWEDDRFVRMGNPVLALADAERRADRATRWSVFVSLDTLVEAEEAGWSTQISGSGERITCFRPELTALAVEAYASGIDLDDYVVQKSIRATGYFEADDPDADTPGGRRRLRRAVSVLVRDTRFRGQILDAYGRRCAMCDLGLSLVQGAHIYPASAPGSDDSLVNGIALCANHHLSFDRHQIAVLPGSLELVFHPDVLSQAGDDLAVRRFIEQTHQVLNQPSRAGAPSDAMLDRRYQYFSDKYGWLNELL
ncbi:HNH endonuclease [Frigoribacterium salinisoli]